jgi:hypothetical protein
MKYLLTYYVGTKVVQSWRFYSKTMAYAMKSELIHTNNFNLGKFKITEI